MIKTIKDHVDIDPVNKSIDSFKKAKKNETNPQYISYHGLNIKIALFCIGAQATGTTSMLAQLDEIPDAVAPIGEMHWYTDVCWEQYNQKHHTQYSHRALFKYNNLSQNEQMHVWNHYCAMHNFVPNVILRKLGKSMYRELPSKGYNITYYVAKGPRQILYPTIANLFVHYYVKYHDTKLLLLLRDPVKRCISALIRFQFESKEHKIMSWLHSKDLKLQQEFNQSLNRIYHKYFNDTMQVTDGVWNEVRNEYKYFFAHRFLPNFSEMNNWLRSCYLPQILQWIFYLEQLQLFHSLKIIQMEQLYVSDVDFQRIMNDVKCFMYSTERNYDQEMNECQNNTKQHFTKISRGRKSGDFVATAEEIQALSSSFSTCNKLLYQFLIRHKYASSILLTNEWIWALWNISY